MLAILADLYTPLFFLQSFWLAHKNKQLRSTSLFLLLSCAVVGGLSALDRWLQVWPTWGMDFSTHSAIIIPPLLVIAYYLHQQYWRVIYGLIALSYLGLMIQLQYHTLVDIISTLLFVTPWVTLVAYRLLYRRDGKK